MAFISHFRVVGEADKTRAIKQLIADSTPSFDFFLMVTLSILMATFGMLLDSPAIVIGSMLIAPILHPVLSLSLGISLSDYNLIGRSFYTLIKAVVIGIGSAILATLFFSKEVYMTGEIIARIEPNLIFFAIAIVSGIAVSYSLVKPELSDTLPGVAVSVALIPPLSVVGIGIARLDWDVVSGAFVLFLINVTGIVFAGMVSFSLMDVHKKRKIAEDAIKVEDKKVEIEEAKVEDVQNKDAHEG
ncbi:MAG: TIGR00341 family protein [Candidatus Paceibacterota bacterium]